MHESSRARVATGEARRSFDLTLPCADAYPLFTPLGETRWVPGWNPEIVVGDGYAPAVGDVFVTATHDHGHRLVWTVVSVEIDRRDDGVMGAAGVRYVRMADGFQVGEIEVRCAAIDRSATRVDVRYRLVGIGDEGAAHVEAFFAPDAYEASIDSWPRLIESALGLAPPA